MSVRSIGTKYSKADHVFTKGNNNFARQEIKQPPKTKNIFLPNLSDWYPEKTFNMPECCLPTH